MARWNTIITLCLAVLFCAGTLAGGNRRAKADLKVTSHSDHEGTYTGVSTEGETHGEAGVLMSGDAKAENYDGLSVADMGLAVVSSRGGSAHGLGHIISQSRKKHGSRVRSGVHGFANRDAAVYGDIDGVAGNRDGFSVGKSDLAVAALGGRSFGEVKGGTRGGRFIAKSHLEANGDTHGTGNVRAGVKFGSEGGDGLLFDQVDGDLVVDSGKKSGH